MISKAYSRFFVRKGRFLSLHNIQLEFTVSTFPTGNRINLLS